MLRRVAQCSRSLLPPRDTAAPGAGSGGSLQAEGLWK